MGIATLRAVVRTLRQPRAFSALRALVVLAAFLVTIGAALMVTPFSVSNLSSRFMRDPAPYPVRPPRSPDLDIVKRQVSENMQRHEFAEAETLDAVGKYESEALELHLAEADARSPRDGDEVELTIVHEPDGVALATRVRNAARSTEHMYVQSPPLHFDERTGSARATALSAIAIAAFLAVGYVFFDAATRGQFTWRLRIVAVVAFAAICVALQTLHQQL